MSWFREGLSPRRVASMRAAGSRSSSGLGKALGVGLVAIYPPSLFWVDCCSRGQSQRRGGVADSSTLLGFSSFAGGQSNPSITQGSLHSDLVDIGQIDVQLARQLVFDGELLVVTDG